MKNTLLIFGLLWALGASGQIYIDSYRFGGGAPPATLLLDDYPNAAAAYSLRKLRTAYTGNCVVVRRASNNDTLAIGFSGNYLDTAALKTFCNGTDCFVRRWYDQSGNAFDVFQNTNANQPRIVASGTLEVNGGTVALNFISADSDRMQSNTRSTGIALPLTTFIVSEHKTIGSFPYIVNQAVIERLIIGTVSTTRRAFNGTTLNYGTTSNNLFELHYVLFDGATSEAAVNNATVSTGNTGTAETFRLVTIGSNPSASAGTFFDGFVHEVITWPSNLSSSRTNIRDLINSFYNVY